MITLPQKESGRRAWQKGDKISDRNVRKVTMIEHTFRNKGPFVSPLLPVSQELVLTVTKRGQLHVAIRVTTKRYDSCAQGALGSWVASRRNFCDAE